jgi:LCP family protein required for cell wall assembly
VDARDMDDYEHCRTDAMIIISIDKKNNEIRQISVYRDTYVHANDEYGYDKITNVHAYAGTEGTLHALNENLDLNIEEVVVVNWKAVANAIDALGGIEIEGLDSEINELNKYMNETARSIGGEVTKVEKAGVQTLDGGQAVTYSRIRKDAATGDYRRNERMKIVVAATVEKALKNPWKIPKCANVALPQVRTNMSSSDIMGLALSFVPNKMTDSVGWPFDTSGWTAYNGAWCGVPVTLNSNVTELHDKYFGQADYTPTKTVQDISAVISSRTGYY